MEAWHLFLQCQTQMQWAGGMISIPVGLRYEAVNIIRRAQGVKSTPELWSKLSIIEAEYITIRHEQAKREM